MAMAQPRSFGELLRRYRIAADLTQTELAERARMSQRTITSLETGSRQLPRKETVALLADALSLTYAERAQLESAARQRPLVAFGPTAAVAPRSPITPLQMLPPLAGRREELLALGRQLAREEPPLLALAGEPGIGKSRLLWEVARRADEQGWTVLCGSCHRRSEQEPFAPFVHALLRFIARRPLTQRRLDLDGCAWLARLLPELAEYAIGPSPSWILPVEQERRLMFAAVERFLTNVAGPAGTLLLLDGLQWAGCDTLDLLAFLLRGSASSNNVPNLRIVGAYSDTDVARHDPLPLLLGDLARENLAATRLLEPLSRAEARVLLAALFADPAHAQTEPIEPPLVETILDRADGVPFFLVHWANALLRGSAAPDVAAHAIPAIVTESIRQRIIVLPDVARDVLAAAAIGRSVSLPVLLTAVCTSTAFAAASEAELLRGIEAVCRARLLCESANGGYCFVHEIVRETVLADLGGARLSVLRCAVAEALRARACPAGGGCCAEVRMELVRRGSQ
ncbi:MAG TPA: AAA family ATPase [Ktedonobacterales bacterium]